MSNDKQIGLALSQYIADYDGVVPPRQTVDASHHVISWRTTLASYTKSQSVYSSFSNPAGMLPDIEHDGYPRSYAVNSTSGQNGVTGPFADSLGGKLNVNDVRDPSTVIAVVESTAAYNDFNPLFPQAFRWSTHKSTNGGHLFVHMDVKTPHTHMLYLDGHVKAVDPMQTLRSTTNPWTIDNGPFTPSDLSTARSVIEFGEKHAKEHVN